MDEPERPKNGKLNMLRNCCIATAVVMVIIFALMFYAINKAFEPKKSIPNLYEIAQAESIVFPVGSKLIHSYKEEGWNNYQQLAAVVEMNTQDVKPFINSLPFSQYSKPAVSRTNRLGISNSMVHFTKKPAWWNPDKAMKFIAVDSFIGMQLLFNLDNPSRTVVYIYSYG